MVERGMHDYFGTRESWSGNCLLWLGSSVLPVAIQSDLRQAFGLEGGRVVPAPLERLDAGLIDELKPRAIVSTLYWRGGDVLDAARQISSFGYRGPYRALSPALPDAALIVREVRSLWPQLDFAIMELAPGIELPE